MTPCLQSILLNLLQRINHLLRCSILHRMTRLSLLYSLYYSVLFLITYNLYYRVLYSLLDLFSPRLYRLLLPFPLFHPSPLMTFLTRFKVRT